MTWVKVCDRSLQRVSSRRCGATAMGFWAGAMCHSAHELLDGKLTAEQLEGDVWWGDFSADAALWAGLLEDELKARLGDVDGAQEILGVVRVAMAAVGKDTEAVVTAIRERLAEHKLLRRPRGRGQHYELMHPDGRPYCKEDGGDQFSREATLERRRKEAETKRRQRAEGREQDELEKELGLGQPLSAAQAAEMLRQSPMSSADAPLDSLGDALPDMAAPSPAREDAKPRRRRQSSAKNAPSKGDSSADVAGAPFSESFVDPSRPSLDDLNSSVQLPDEVLLIQRELRQQSILAPLAKDWTLSVALYRSLTALRVGVQGALIAIRETAAAASLGSAMGTIKSFRHWATATLLDRLKKATDGKVSEVEHLERVGHRRTPQEAKRLAQERRVREEQQRMSTTEMARQAQLAALAIAGRFGAEVP